MGIIVQEFKKNLFCDIASFSKTSYINGGPSTIAAEECKAFASPLPLFIFIILEISIKIFTANRG